MKRGHGLKRSGALERRTPLARGDKPLKRSKPLSAPASGLTRKKRRTLKSKQREPLGAIEAALAYEFARKVCSRQCVMCKEFPVSDEIRAAHGPDLNVREAHHIVAKRHLRREGLHTQLWNSDNGISLCRFHHARHESAAQRVPRRLLMPPAFVFAHDVGLAWVLDREYV